MTRQEQLYRDYAKGKQDPAAYLKAMQVEIRKERHKSERKLKKWYEKKLGVTMREIAKMLHLLILEPGKITAKDKKTKAYKEASKLFEGMKF